MQTTFCLISATRNEIRQEDKGYGDLFCNAIYSVAAEPEAQQHAIVSANCLEQYNWWVAV